MILGNARSGRPIGSLLSIMLCSVALSSCNEEEVGITCLPRDVARDLQQQAGSDEAAGAKAQFGQSKPPVSVNLYIDGSPSMAGYQGASVGDRSSYALMLEALRRYGRLRLDDEKEFRESKTENVAALISVIDRLKARDWQKDKNNKVLTLVLTDLWFLDNDNFHEVERLARRLRELVEDDAAVGIVPFKSRFSGHLDLPSSDLATLSKDPIFTAELGRKEPTPEPPKVQPPKIDWNPSKIEFYINEGHKYLRKPDKSAAILNFDRALRMACEAIANGNEAARPLADIAVQQLARIPDAGYTKCPVAEALSEPAQAADSGTTKLPKWPGNLSEAGYHFDGQRGLFLILIGRPDHIAHIRQSALSKFIDLPLGAPVFTRQNLVQTLTSKDVKQDISRGLGTLKAGRISAVFEPDLLKMKGLYEHVIEVAVAKDEDALTLEIPLRSNAAGSLGAADLYTSIRYWLYEKAVDDCDAAWQTVLKPSRSADAEIKSGQLIFDLPVPAALHKQKGWTYFLDAKLVANAPTLGKEETTPKEPLSWSLNPAGLSKHILDIETASVNQERGASQAVATESHFGTPSLTTLYSELARVQGSSQGQTVVQVLLAFRSD